MSVTGAGDFTRSAAFGRCPRNEHLDGNDDELISPTRAANVASAYVSLVNNLVKVFIKLTVCNNCNGSF